MRNFLKLMAADVLDEVFLVVLFAKRSVAHLPKIKYCSSFSIEVNPHANEVRIQPIFLSAVDQHIAAR